MYMISDNIDTCTGMRIAGFEGAVVHGKKKNSGRDIEPRYGR